MINETTIMHIRVHVHNKILAITKGGANTYPFYDNIITAIASVHHFKSNTVSGKVYLGHLKRALMMFSFLFYIINHHIHSFLMLSINIIILQSSKCTESSVQCFFL